MRTPEELTDRFRSQGLKVTPQRQAVFRILHGHHGHPTAEAVHADVVRELPMVSLRTVYQTLNDLTAMGEIGHIELGTGSARFDPTLDEHHHLVCDVCGDVADLAADFPDVVVPEDDDHGFEVTHTDIVFRGRCAACSTDSAANPASPTRSHTRTTNHKEAQRHG